jgi:murein L,D-transpeptidase YafK
MIPVPWLQSVARRLAMGLVFLLPCAMPVSGEEVDRVAVARPRVEPILREKFRAAGLTYPAGEMFLRVFKREGLLEFWARAKAADEFKLIHTYTALAASGGPGPKRREGDRQVPEGFYEVDRFNPKSLFHLSLGLNYPNASDRILSDRQRPGGDIFIHGSNVTIGCVPLGNDLIEEVYIAALDSRARPIRVHLFPARMNAADWPAWRDEQAKEKPGLAPFWEQLQKGFELFESTHRLPAVTVEKDGRYVCKPQ